jgi:putative two-component system response regulator
MILGKCTLMSGTKKVILIVDDTPDNILMITGLLGGVYKIKAATSGEKALKIAQKFPSPDLILLDVMMPEMDGFEVCQHLKSNPATEEIPVVFVSGHTDEAEREKGLSLGALDFISKPIVPGTLQATISSVLESG